MYYSDSCFKMTRIILNLLLVSAWTGFAICSTDESVIAYSSEFISFPQKEKVVTEETKSTIIESSSNNNDENDTNSGYVNKNISDASSSSMVQSSSVKEKVNLELSSTETDAFTATPYKTTFNSNLQTSASDIDYGGFNTTDKDDSITESDIKGEFIRANLLKSPDDEFIPLISNEVEVSNDELEKKIVMPIFVPDNLHTISVNMTEPYIETNHNVNKSMSDDSLVAKNFGDNVKNLHRNNEQKVSASPKSATRKRSLNSTGGAIYDFTQVSNPGTFTPDIADTTAFLSSSSKVDSFDTTIKIEELPTPLPEVYNQTPKSQATTRSATVISKQGSGDHFKNVDLTESNEFSTKSGITANSGESMKSTSTSKLIDHEVKTTMVSLEKESSTDGVSMASLSDDNVTQLENVELQTQSNGVLGHENDDIIYAGFADEDPLGVTFDPDGMKNDFPQDPDSIIFSVTPKNRQPSTETNTDLSSFERDVKPTMTWKHLEHLPHDSLESELESLEMANAENHEIKDSNDSEIVVPPAVVFSRPISYSSEEMLQDASSLNDNYNASHTKVKISDKIESILPNSPESKSINTSYSPSNESKEVELNDEFIPTEQSVIRPVKISSPSTKPTSTPANVITSSPQPAEFGIGNEFSTTTDTSILKEVQDVSTNLSSPIILPNSAPSITEKSVKSSTVVARPEKIDIISDKSLLPPDFFKEISDKSLLPPDFIEENTTSTSEGNSTIAGVAVKTSVSVSLPISIKENSSQDYQKANDANLSPTLRDENFSDSKVSTSSPASTSVPTTEAPTSSTTSVKIRKPSIRVPGRTDGHEVRTRKPYIPPRPRSSSTAGPPVSIFKKERTRINSITSSTTSKPLPEFSTIRVHYASRYPGMKPEEFLVSVAPVTVPTTTTTEEPISEIPFTDTTMLPNLTSDDNVMLVKVGGGITLEKGLRWSDQLSNRHSPEFKEKATQIHVHLENLFRSSPIAPRLWRIEIDGFNGTKNSRPVEVDFILYLIKSTEKIAVEHLARVFHEKLSTNNTFARYRVDPTRTAFEMLQEEPLRQPTPSPEDDYEPPVPQWAIAVIVICAASLIFIVLFAAVTMYGRHHMRRRYGNKLNEDELDRSSGEWESKMTAAYENMAADTIYEAEDLRGDTYKKQSRIATFHGIPSTLKRCESWSSGDWSTPPRRKKPPHVH